MSDRTPDEKKKDLANALVAVADKTIDGIPWYQAEALAERITTLIQERDEARARLAEYEKPVGESEVDDALARELPDCNCEGYAHSIKCPQYLVLLFKRCFRQSQVRVRELEDIVLAQTIKLRAASWDGERCKHGVWSADRCYQCEP